MRNLDKRKKKMGGVFLIKQDFGNRIRTDQVTDRKSFYLPSKLMLGCVDPGCSLRGESTFYWLLQNKDLLRRTAGSLQGVCLRLEQKS